MGKFFCSVLLVVVIVFQQPGIVSSCMSRFGESMFQRASGEIREGIENSVKELTGGFVKIANSLDNGVVVGAELFRELTYNMSKLLGNLELRVNSGDLAHIGADASDSLRLALADLSTKWQIAIRSEDLRLIGGEAFGHLSRAIQNVNAKFSFHFSIDENLKSATLYASVSFGTGIAVVGIVLIICLKGSRKCTVAIVQALQRLPSSQVETETKAETTEMGLSKLGESAEKDEDVNGTTRSNPPQYTITTTTSLRGGERNEGPLLPLCIFEGDRSRCCSSADILQTHF